MAETKADPFEALKKKVGPLPLGVWLALGLGVWWYLNKGGKKGSAPPAAGTSQTGYGTDPAGNTGYIDPSTGYVYGSAEDIAALQSQGLVGANSYNTPGGTSGTGAGVGGGAGAGGGTVGGTDTTTGAAGSGASAGGSAASGGSAPVVNGSGTAVTTPPNTTTPPVTSTGGSTTTSNNKWSYPAPSGLQAYSVSDSGFRLRWNAVTGPNGQHPSSYTTAIWQLNGKKVSQQVVGSTASVEYGPGGAGLHAGWQYKAQVWANGGPIAPAGSVIVVTLPAK